MADTRGRALEFVYGPSDGDTAVPPAGVREGAPVFVVSDFLTASGRPVFAVYLVATHATCDASCPGFVRGQPHELLVFDGWYEDAPGDRLGKRLGGLCR